MGLKCSVLGHSYGEATVEREREEQGSEVVITIQERETCARCGNSRIVSENKEVTSIETPADIAGDVVEDQAAESTGTGPEREDLSEPVDTGQRPGPAESAAPDSDPVTPVFEDDIDEAQIDDDIDPADPETDDAEIMEPTEEGVSSGDAELDEPSTAVDVPEAESAVTNGEEATSETDDGIILGEEDEEASPERAPGEWPEEPRTEESEWQPETALSEAEEEAAPQGESSGSGTVTVPEGQYRCDECGFTTDVESSSLRAGDFCPECKRGALLQHGDE